MRDLKQILAETDEEYLIGLSNKGIVKRAHKDMETVEAKVCSVADEAKVLVGSETVTICSPLGESKCTCPSRSICRHVVQALLVLKKELGDGAGSTKPEAGTSIDRTSLEIQGDTEGTDGVNIQAGAVEEAGSEASPAGNTVLWQEIRSFSVQKARRVMGSRYFRQFAEQVQAGVRPKIRETSVITVPLPGQEFTVKLLSPLDYASCTCHKKELCAHKAAAILWCQYQAGMLTAQELEQEAQQQPEWDPALVKEAAGSMKRFLEVLLDTGLARAAPEVMQDMERMAIIGHNAGLARFESSFRALRKTCSSYFRRAASFRIQEWIRQLTELYAVVCFVLEARESEEIAAYAGSFRGRYQVAGELALTGIVLESFESRSGYAGETVYFLDEKEQKWYTYTNARPVFYEGSRRFQGNGKSQAPWGLSLTLEELASVRICLKGARVDERGRLSASGESRAETAGGRKFSNELLASWYYDDFLTLFTERIRGRDTGEETGEAQDGLPEKRPELAFVRPADFGVPDFSDTRQLFTLPLLDRAGRELIVEVAYSKRESDTIRYLERYIKKWRRDLSDAEKAERKPPCFLGKIYLQNGRIHMYPLALFEEKEMAEVSGIQQDGQITYPQMDAGGVSAVREVTKEAAGLMEELCQSGLNTVHDDTLEALGKMKDTAEAYGLTGLSEMVTALWEAISMRRHRTRTEEDDAAALYGKINRYLYLCGQKIRWDEAYEYYRGGTGL